ncbi:MAG: lipase family protein [Xanthobacteraceae bacterium]
MSLFTKIPEDQYSPAAFSAFRCTRDFDLGVARSLMWMSQLAYENDEPDKIERILARWGMQFVDDRNGMVSKEVKTVLPIASTHAIVVAGHGATIVAFAGTDPVVLANWITDFNARVTLAGSAEGYQTAAAAVWPQLRSLLGKRPAANDKVYVTGHSLGGALAALTALRIETDSVADVEAVYTFGMPRPGSPQFASQYDQAGLGMRTYRLVDADDIVPTVAPSFLNFHHVGRHLHCTRGGKFDAGTLTANASSDDPGFVEDAVKAVRDLIHSPMSQLLSLGQRLKLATALALGRAPGNMRSDPVGVAIELLPPRVRDHLPDRYIGAL